MLTFPQLSTGALVQYPIRKKLIQRTVYNVTEDMHRIALSDPNGALIQWDIQLVDLSDAEVSSLVAFFESCEGRLQPFPFIDPTANLLSYSEDYSQPVWQRNSLIALSPGATDPYGTARASTLINTSAGALTLTQTVQIPGSAWLSFRGHIKATAPVPLTVSRNDGSTLRTLLMNCSTSWQQFTLSSVFSSSVSTQCDVSLSFPPGSSVTVFALQLDPQPFPGKYVSTTAQTGVYPNSRFNMDQLTITATGVGQSSVNISIVSKASQ